MAANVVAGKPLATGGVLIAALGTVLPTDATTALDEAFKGAGYIGEDGLTETTERSTEKVKAWGGDTVKVLQTDFAVSYQFTFLETLNGDVLRTVYGDANVTTTPATAEAGTLHAVKINGETLPHKTFVFEVKDGEARIRIVVPDGQITEVGEVTYADGEVVGYQVTVEAFVDPTLGANAVKYVDDGKKTA
ncbi:phage tail tube protein [Nocardioides ochotonae]|uniref:phage tail tube protein n=1 Tax=Nocardioides ochotonae TaxID=2685869 RepID=UPI0014074A3D|nr:hypothetical protein [Nocardioides ochotonae]